MMMDDDIPMTAGGLLPWLDQPVMLESSRAYSCSFNDTAMCTYQQGYWHFWYQADHRYALPTVALFLSTILVFAVPFLLSTLWPSAATSSKPRRRLAALTRWLSYRQFRIGALNWNSAPLGVLFLGAVGVIFFFSMTLGPKPYYWPNTKTVNYGDSPPLATRAGWQALACLPFVLATSSKSNLITAMTGVSHEKLQVFHRWISYAMFVLALIHTFPFIVYHIHVGDMVMQWKTSVAYWTGVAAIIPQAYLTFASISPLRNMAYEWFKLTHFLAGVLFIVFFFFHCDFRLSSWDYFVAAGVVYTLTWLHSQLRVYFQNGIGKKATIHLVANGFIRVGIPTNNTWRTGQHYFVRFLSLGLHACTSHPFTACSLPTKASFYEAKDSELVFYIRPQGGLTARLAKYAEQHPGSKMRVLLDGPYGGVEMPKLSSYQNLLVIAGGSGAGWCLPLIESFLRRKDCSTCCNAPADAKDGEAAETDCNIPSMKVILATRDLATRDWFEAAVNELLTSSLLGACPPGLVVEVHYTGGEANATAPAGNGQFLQKLDDPEKVAVAVALRPRDGDSSSESASESSLPANGAPFALSLRDFPARPNLPHIIRDACAKSSVVQVKNLGIFVCGPTSMQHDVSNAVAREQVAGMRDGERDIYLHMEHFSWA